MGLFNSADKSEIRVIQLYEDDEDDAFLLKKALDQTKDIKIQIVASGLKALTALDKLPEADIIFLDADMLHMDGIECLTRIRNINKNIPVIILTTSYNESLIKQAQTLGASGFISIPDSFKEYRSAIKAALTTDWGKLNQ